MLSVAIAVHRPLQPMHGCLFVWLQSAGVSLICTYKVMPAIWSHNASHCDMIVTSWLSKCDPIHTDWWTHLMTDWKLHGHRPTWACTWVLPISFKPAILHFSSRCFQLLRSVPTLSTAGNSCWTRETMHVYSNSTQCMSVVGCKTIIELCTQLQIHHTQWHSTCTCSNLRNHAGW